MPGIQLTGLSTGIDTSLIVEQLMMLESQRLNAYKVDLKEEQDIAGALGTLENRLNALQDALADLSDASGLRAYNATSSDTDIATAEASQGAFEGNHTVTVDQLASAERWVHSSGLEYAEDYVGAGTFIFSYNRQEIIVTTTEKTTLEDLVGLINNDADNPGLTASLLNYNDAYHLVLGGNEAGSDYEVAVNDSNTEVWQADSELTVGGENADLTTKIIDLDQFSGTLAGGEYITISGRQHDGTVVSQDFTISENTKIGHLIGEINDTFAGAATATLLNGKIVLTDHTNGASQMELTLTYNGSGGTTLDVPAISQSTQGGSVSATLAGFATADFVETQSAQDSRIKVDGFPTGADEWIERSSNTIDDVISGVTLHLHDTGTVQVGLTRDIESVKDKLNKMVESYNAVIAFVQENTGYSEATQTAGLLSDRSAVRSIVSQMRLPLIERTDGFLSDVDSFLMPGQLGLELDRDGMLSLDATAFADAVAEDYMGVLALIGASKAGSSDSNTIEFYGASSRHTASGTYEVEVTISGGAITGARMKRIDEVSYRSADYEGNLVTGDSTFDDNGNPMYPENGLRLSVDLTQDGTFTATVRVRQGFAGAMEDVVRRVLDTRRGLLPSEQEAAQSRIDNVKDRIEAEQDRLDAREARLRAKFTRLESTLTMLQRQMEALQMG
jgi:flagellar hook-associated protein 2